jgi:hypothetical protein
MSDFFAFNYPVVAFVISKGIGRGMPLALPGSKQPDIYVKVDWHGS